jgi:hypothetical protein
MKTSSMKKTYLICLIAVILTCIALTCGCSSPDTSTPSTGDQTPAATTAAPGTQLPTASPDRTPVHYTTLLGFLPTSTSNWVAGEPYGMSMSEQGTSYSVAFCAYDHKTVADIMVTVWIQDTGGEEVGYWQMWDTFYAFDTPEASWKSATVDLYPAWIFHDKTNDDWAEYVGLPNGVIVMVLVENGKEDYITVFNNQIDFRGLAAL